MVVPAQRLLPPAREFRAARPALSITCLGSDPDILVDLTTARTAFEAEMIAESLRAQGIPAEAFTTAGSTLQWDIAATQPMRIQVRRRDLARAAEVLRAIRAESVDLDWSQVDTGDRSPVTPEEITKNRVREICTRCGYDVTGLERDGVCPECGLGITNPVREVRPMSRRRRALFMAGLFLLGVGFFATTFASRVWDWSVAPWLAFAMMVLVLISVLIALRAGVRNP
jgi:hypothetical protein